MKQWIRYVGWIALIIFLTPGISAAGVPREIAGIVLGEPIDKYSDRLKMDTAQPIRHQEYLREVQIKDTEELKSGVVWYGTSTTPGRIVRIKLKYNDPSKAFFDKLLKEFNKRFGKPTEWRGDCFGIYIAWKWSFKDADSNRISMVLQHNIKDPNQKMGNNIKLTMWDLIDNERRIYEQMQGRKKEKPAVIKPKDYKPEEWERLIPR